MPKFRKKPVDIDAYQWFKNGDHPDDEIYMVSHPDGDFASEGKVVRYYRHPDIDGDKICTLCSHSMHFHGWIDTLEGGHTVCVGDWIITGVVGERYPCKPNVFEITYDPIMEKEENWEKKDEESKPDNL